MSVYMYDIPQTKENTLRLSSVKIYGKSGKCSDLPVPRKGEEITGVYCSGEKRFEMTGLVDNVCYNTSKDWIVVECNCTEIRKI